MAVPAVLALIRVGQVVYKVAKSPAAQKMARDLIKRYGAKPVEKATKSTGTSVKSKVKNLTQGRYEGILKDKTPSLTSKVGGRVNQAFGGKPVTRKSPGVEKGTATVGTARSAGTKTGTKVFVGIGVVGGAIGKTAYDKLTEAQKSKFVKTDDGKYVPKAKTKPDPRKDKQIPLPKQKPKKPKSKVTPPKPKPKPKKKQNGVKFVFETKKKGK
tara:strand:- start:10 stop:648 length:639 start_codon:yes stop_codon:yes gene_type:complete